MREPIPIICGRPSRGIAWHELLYQRYYVNKLNQFEKLYLKAGDTLEFAVHPGNNYCPRLRFTTPKAGTYMVTAIARNLDYGSVDVGLTAAGIPLAKMYATCPWVGDYTPDKGQIMQAQTTWLAAGEAIELMVYCHNGNANDATGLYFDVVRLPDEAWEGVDFGGALAASFKQDAPSNPFTDENGTWTCGKVSTGFFSQLEPNAISDVRANGAYRGWQFAQDYGCTVCANVTDTMVEPPPYSDMSAMTMHPHEMFIHPYENGQGTVLRFSPKEAKVYDLYVYARDVNTGNDNWGEPVCLAVTVNGVGIRSYAFQVQTIPMYSGYFPSGFGISCYCWEVNRQVKGIYLGPNDTIEIRIHSLDQKSNYYCGTGVRAWLMPSLSACESFLNVDIEGSGTGSLFDGTAAAGFAGARWTQARPGETTHLKLNGRRETKVGFNLVRGGSQAAVTDRQDGANALMDCGVVSANAEDPYQFTLNKLVPGANYRLVFYGDANAQFTVGEKSARVSEMCFTPGGKEYCVLDVVADANGLISGTFASAEGEASARFCGLQIGGATDSFALRTGLVMIVE